MACQTARAIPARNRVLRECGRPSICRAGIPYCSLRRRTRRLRNQSPWVRSVRLKKPLLKSADQKAVMKRSLPHLIAHPTPGPLGAQQFFRRPLVPRWVHRGLAVAKRPTTVFLEAVEGRNTESGKSADPRRQSGTFAFPITRADRNRLMLRLGGFCFFFRLDPVGLGDSTQDCP